MHATIKNSSIVALCRLALGGVTSSQGNGTDVLLWNVYHATSTTMSEVRLPLMLKLTLRNCCTLPALVSNCRPLLFHLHLCMVSLSVEELATYRDSLHVHFIAVWAHCSTSMVPCTVFARSESSFWMH